jgi:hypothetical protein
MKKEIILFVLLIVFGDKTYAQSYELLDINNVSAKLRPNGILFDNHFEVPIGSGLNTMRSATIWIGGLSTDQTLRIAAGRYGIDGNDYFFGPAIFAGTNSQYNSSDYIQRYNRVWKINKSDIDFHVVNYMLEGYVVPSAIMDWPGNGNTNNGEAHNLAPYVDANENNIYDPENGDYPEIRGDQAVFALFNDHKNQHTESGDMPFSPAIGVEYQVMLYGYNASDNPTLNETVFMNVKIINRNTHRLTETYVGIWGDYDIGNSTDDFMGSNCELKMIYAYNADNYDEGGYGDNPPVQGCVLLNKTINKAVIYSEGTSFFNDPEQTSHYYNYMRGIWKNGQSITYGGNDANPAGAEIIRYMYSGYPESYAEWTESNVGNAPGNRRGLISFGPFTYEPGDTVNFDVAYIYARDSSENYLLSIPLLRERAEYIHSFFGNTEMDCNEIIPLDIVETDVTKHFVYPNPAQEQLHITLPLGARPQDVLSVYDMHGRLVKEQSVGRYAGTITVDISRLSGGMYVVRYSGKDIVLVKQFVKE